MVAVKASTAVDEVLSGERGWFVTLGDCIERLKALPDASVDAVVTDPPYGLEFMGKEWDGADGFRRSLNKADVGRESVFGRQSRTSPEYRAGHLFQEWTEAWAREVLRVLKPGGHLLAFGGSRTYHRLAVAVEDAGFEIRDQIMWVYGCLSEDAEVLTVDGWEPYHASIHKDILAYDYQADVYQWERPSRWSEYRVESDTAYRIESDSTDQIVSRGHRCLVERDGALTLIPADELAGVERVPYLRSDFPALPQGRGELLLEAMLREGEGVAQATCSERQRQEETRQGTCGVQKSGVEGRVDVFQEEGQIRRSANQVRSVPEGVLADGAKGRLCHGTPSIGGDGLGPTIAAERVCSSCQPRRHGQSTGESDAVRDERGPQEARARPSYRTTLATVTPIKYTGLIFCPTVSTGAFVARRNGKVFVTGNSGFPKSLDVSKAIQGYLRTGNSRYSGNRMETTGKEQSLPGSQMQEASSLTMADGGQAWSGKTVAVDDPDALQWQGWGTALKPSHEPLVWAQKPATHRQDSATIGSNLSQLGACLWSLLPANVADEISGSSPSASDAGAFGFAQWSADERSNTLAALCAQMDTSQFVSATISSLNTVSSWLGILAAILVRESTSTTETVSSTTTDWTTLRSCLSAITPASIILAHSQGRLSIADACPATRYFSATVAGWSAILELSALAPAIAQCLDNSLDVGARPAHEPIVMARKPLVGTVAENVLTHGTGAINVDGCRVDARGETWDRESGTVKPNDSIGTFKTGVRSVVQNPQGRWPANFIHDGSDEVLELFPVTKAGVDVRHKGGGNTFGGDKVKPPMEDMGYGDTGSAARFFYTAKASKGEKYGALTCGCAVTQKVSDIQVVPLKESGTTQRPPCGTCGQPMTVTAHPTVKPQKIMEWLIKLVTPPGGLVLDPFTGSGSTGVAARRLGFRFLGMEQDKTYCAIARARCRSAID